jgi:hypothetical protein
VRRLRGETTDGKERKTYPARPSTASWMATSSSQKSTGHT